MSSFLTPNYPPPTESKLKEEAANSSQKSGSFLTPNYPPPARKSKEENIAEAQASSKKGNEEGSFQDDGTNTGGGAPPVNWVGCGIAMGAMVLIFGVIIGILVGRNNSLDTSDPAPAPAPAPSNETASASSGGTATTVDLGGCELMIKDFTANDLVLTMSVSSTISPVEINYASSVFGKTYTGLLKNEIAAATDKYCDPYCRDIKNITISGNSLNLPAVEARQAEPNCDATLELTFTITGTFVGCEDTVFPGLFSSGRRQLVQVQQPSVRFDIHRALEGHGGGDADADMMMDEPKAECPSCASDEATLGFASPTLDGIKSLLNDYVSVLPAVCELTEAMVMPGMRK